MPGQWILGLPSQEEVSPLPSRVCILAFGWVICYSDGLVYQSRSDCRQHPDFICILQRSRRAVSVAVQLVLRGLKGTRHPVWLRANGTSVYPREIEPHGGCNSVVSLRPSMPRHVCLAGELNAGLGRRCEESTFLHALCRRSSHDH